MAAALSRSPSISCSKCGRALEGPNTSCPDSDRFAVCWDNCSHITCNACLDAMVTACCSPLLPCPFVNTEEKCSGYLDYETLKSLLPVNLFSEYESRVERASTIQKNKKVKDEVEKPLTDQQKSDGWFHLKARMDKLQATGVNAVAAAAQLDFMPIIPTAYPIHCLICLSDVDEEEGIVLKACLHMFCRSCLQAHVEHCPESVEVPCPYRDAEDGTECEDVLKPQELAHLSSEHVYRQHYEAGSIGRVNKASNMVHCLTPNCTYFVEYDDQLSVDHHFTCPLCHQLTCIQCKVQHTGRTCQQHKQLLADKQNHTVQRQNEVAGEQEVQRRIATGICKKCPQCHIVIEKNEGCDHMTCRNCRYEFHWSTGGQYRRGIIGAVGRLFGLR